MPTLSALLDHSRPETRRHGLGALARMCSQLPSVVVPVEAIGSVAAFCDADAEPRAREDAAAVLVQLAASAANARPILSSGAARSLATLMRDGGDSAAELAALALDALTPALCGAYAERLVHCEAGGAASLLQSPPFWCDGMLRLLAPTTQATYPALAAASSDFYFELFHLCALVRLRQAAQLGLDAAADGENAARDVHAVLETFENEPAALAFLASIFPIVAARGRACIGDFDGFDLAHLPDVARLGNEVLNRVRGMPLAERALRALYERHLAEQPPSKWKHLFREAARMAYNLKYMFRESIDKTKQQFVAHLDRGLGGDAEGDSGGGGGGGGGGARAMYAKLVHGAFELYGGLVDQPTLAATDFLTNPQALVDVVMDGVRGADARVQLIGEIAARYMQTYIDATPPKLPLTPHHTQIVAMLIFSQFFERRDECAAHGLHSAILQMQTGEGKSIVIAMMAIYTVKQLGKRVHVLENNEGLLERDFANYEPLYKSFGLSCAKQIDATSDICYCLKAQNNAHFNQQLLRGELNLGEVVLIVDEVDDLVVNEKPSLLYTARDELLTPQHKACYRALIRGEPKPERAAAAPLPQPVWHACVRVKREAGTKVRGVDYERGARGWEMLEAGPDGAPRFPKVALTDDWLVYKNFEDFQLEPSKDTFRNCLCTPYLYGKYAAIFGLTGSVGGEAERAYIQKSYGAVPFEVPQFLHTCEHTSKQDARCLGVRIAPTTQQMVAEVARAACRHHTRVPVLVITRGAEGNELQRVRAALVEALAAADASGETDDDDDRGGGGGGGGGEPVRTPFSLVTPSAAQPASPTKKPRNGGGGGGGGAEAARSHGRLQVLQARNEAGESLIERCGAVVEAATRRCYTQGRRSYFPVTLTDGFGGRGHDFDCMDEKANAEGGMLVIATSVPDAREWAQWKGRTARQDRPGQFLVVLSAEDEPFASEAGLAQQLGARPPDEIVSELLRRKDAGIARALSSFEAQQARGAWLNELCERYYRERPRAAAAAWPSEAARASDLKLRGMLEVPFPSGAKIRDAAAARLGLALEGPPATWGWAADAPFGIEPRRPNMAVTFLIDRTFEGFLQNVVDAVVNLFDRQLEPDDLVGYYGLGDSWIFPVQRRGDGDAAAALREQIVGSVEKRGEPHFYSSIETCVSHLAHSAEVPDSYSRWLVVLTDTVDFECVNAKNHFDKESPQRAEAAVARVTQLMASVHGLHLVVVDASAIPGANFNPKHSLWPTWRRLAQRLTDDVGEANVGLSIQAADVGEIDDAFEKIAGAMSGGAAG